MHYEIAQMEVAQNAVVKKQHFECFNISGLAVRISGMSTSHAFSVLCKCLTSTIQVWYITALCQLQGELWTFKIPSFLLLN